LNGRNYKIVKDNQEIEKGIYCYSHSTRFLFRMIGIEEQAKIIKKLRKKYIITHIQHVFSYSIPHFIFTYAFFHLGFNLLFLHHSCKIWNKGILWLCVWGGGKSRCCWNIYLYWFNSREILGSTQVGKSNKDVVEFSVGLSYNVYKSLMAPMTCKRLNWWNCAWVWWLTVSSCHVINASIQIKCDKTFVIVN